ncbi:hypothetical protein V6N11_002133 [Hibiscus sabdariffa]|uniref:CHY-type domain-containing protein n=1 Tax=Hibiscus sabdariffa TaxID=183260 RepID=A0ABR2QUJ2_9ROSI
MEEQKLSTETLQDVARQLALLAAQMNQLIKTNGEIDQSGKLVDNRDTPNIDDSYVFDEMFEPKKNDIEDTESIMKGKTQIIYFAEYDDQLQASQLMEQTSDLRGVKVLNFSKDAHPMRGTVGTPQVRGMVRSSQINVKVVELSEGGFVVTVMEYVVNSSQGNSILSYWDLIFSPTLVEMEASSTNQHPHFEKMGYGCQHYKRRCKMRAPFCNNFLSCHHYHNEIVNLLSNPFDRHELVRKDVKLFAWLVTLRSRLL